MRKWLTESEKEKKLWAESPWIGIDLGTTFTVVALYKGDQEPEVVRNVDSQAKYGIPSVVAIKKDGSEDAGSNTL